MVDETVCAGTSTAAVTTTLADTSTTTIVVVDVDVLASKTVLLLARANAQIESFKPKIEWLFEFARVYHGLAMTNSLESNVRSVN